MSAAFRHQLPVASPVRAGAIAAGLRAAIAPTAGARARAELARRVDSPGVILTDSGTSALVLALRLLVPAGGTVALPAWGCIDLSAAAVFARVRVRLYDLDPATLGPDPESLDAALGRGADAVVVAHFHGYPADVPAARAIAARYGARVIDDAAQRAGGRLHGAPLGTLGDAGVLSFGRGKGVTGGSGGALLLRDAETAMRLEATVRRRLRGTRSLVTTAAQWSLGRPALYGIPAGIPGLRLGEMVYHPAHEPGPIADSAAAMILHALAREPEDARVRRENAKRIMAATAPDGDARFVAPIDGALPGYLRLGVRRAAGAAPMPRAGILQGYPLTLEEHAPLRPLLLPGEVAGPGARELRSTLFTIPTHAMVTPGDRAAVGRWLRAAPRTA